MKPAEAQPLHPIQGLFKPGSGPIYGSQGWHEPMAHHNAACWPLKMSQHHYTLQTASVPDFVAALGTCSMECDLCSLQ